MEKQVLIVVGHKDGLVYLRFRGVVLVQRPAVVGYVRAQQSGGTEGVPPNYVAWIPAGAREVAALLLTAADEAEGVATSTGG